ncbi:hypothetical protein ACFQV8_01270 [Pseudonocardia benzenivorans]
MSRVPITLACWDYDRTRALSDGRIRPDGVALTYLDLPVEETFFRMLRHREFEAAEMSLASYVTHVAAAAEPDLVAIPVFPSRAFRHHGVYVRADDERDHPADLAGGVVGVPEYQLTANVWIRGILADRHGLPVSAVRYRTGGMHEPGRIEKQALDLPADIEVEPIPADHTLVQMLLDGEIDALYAPRTPRPLLAGRAPSARSSETRGPRRSGTPRTPGSSRSCTRWCCAATSTTPTRGWRGRCSPRSSGPRR